MKFSANGKALPTQLNSWFVESANGVVWLRSPLLHAAGFAHAFSTRIGGVSPAPFDSMNLGIADAPGEPDEWTRVNENWRRLLLAGSMGERQLVRAAQVHGCALLHADRQPEMIRSAPPFVQGDAVLSGDARHALAIRVADCVPVLIADVATRVVAAVHAGWRGVACEIIPATLREFAARGTRMHNVRMAIGPCIQQASFQIGESVAIEFQQRGLGQCVIPDSNCQGKWLGDLPGAICQQAHGAGVAPEHIDNSKACTYQNPEYFFSFRRDGARSGRLAALIGA
ncbi:MAG: laccase domain-containing protein [Phycisphaerales bacterium]|nr:laccase domain-containing protein [Phycisphaerales bacterium]